MNAQVHLTVEQLRQSLCSQLIGAGITNPDDIVNTAQTLENFIYEGTKRVQPPAEPKTTVQEVKTAEPTEAVAEEATAETKTAEPQTHTAADIKSALMRVAKANRNAFNDILKQIGVTTVPSIAEADYSKVMQLVENFESENA